MLNSDLESLNGLKPHSYIVNFSVSSNLDDKRNDKKKIIVDKTILKIKKKNIQKYVKQNIKVKKVFLKAKQML